MLPEIGHFSLILGLCFSMLLSVFPWFCQKHSWCLSYMTVFARATGCFMLIAFICLALSFVADDFSVQYVAENSNTLLPTPYKIAATWGGHEGSLLLWVLCISAWMVAVTWYSKHIDDRFVVQVLAVLGMIIVGFASFIVLTSNPFLRLLIDTPTQGRDLNPLLQDLGLIIHPPMLYMGYVGFSVSFAFAIAALIGGRIDAAWIRWCRPWVLVAWMFLTGGIALGSWWAYYELGWGGWWFWDPVENASFMPWLIGTALLHALNLSEKRGLFYQWTVLLSLFAFLLSLLGTFLVRSGVLTSVHSFAADPDRGLYILMLLLFAIVGSLFLYGLRARYMRSNSQVNWHSKEVYLLAGNIILVISCFTVLLGTLYPLMIDALGLGKISVGAPYFNHVFVPLVALLFVLMGFAPFVRWKKDQVLKEKPLLLRLASLALGFGLFVPLGVNQAFNAWATLGLGTAAWIVLATGFLVVQKISTPTGWHWHKINRPMWAMILAHLGVAVSIVGATMASQYTQERSVRMGVDTYEEMAGYRFTFLKSDWVEHSNYKAQRAWIEVSQNDHVVAMLVPERRFYPVRTMNMSEAGIDWGVFRDLYVTLGEELGNNTFAVRLNYKPFMRWLWWGALLMIAGGLFATSAQIKKTVHQKAAQKKANPVLKESRA
jgi:cytochrome c-type biogenesis protein CcmF